MWIMQMGWSPANKIRDETFTQAGAGTGRPRGEAEGPGGSGGWGRAGGVRKDGEQAERENGGEGGAEGGDLAVGMHLPPSGLQAAPE